MRWAKHVIAHRRDLIMVLLDIMAVTRANDAVEVERARLAKERAESRPSSAGGTGSGNGNLGVVTAGGENNGAQEGSRGGSVHGAGAKDGLVGIPEDEESTYAEPPTTPPADVSEVATSPDQARPMGGLPSSPPPPRVRRNPPCSVYPERPSSWCPALRRSSRAWGTTTTWTRRGANGRRSSATEDPAGPGRLRGSRRRGVVRPGR